MLTKRYERGEEELETVPYRYFKNTFFTDTKVNKFWYTDRKLARVRVFYLKKEADWVSEKQVLNIEAHIITWRVHASLSTIYHTEPCRASTYHPVIMIFSSIPLLVVTSSQFVLNVSFMFLFLSTGAPAPTPQAKFFSSCTDKVDLSKKIGEVLAISSHTACEYIEATNVIGSSGDEGLKPHK